MADSEADVGINGTKRIDMGLVLAVAVMFLRHDAVASQAPVSLGSATEFGVLAGSTVTSTGVTTINGGLGLNPGTVVTESPVIIVNGPRHITDTTVANALVALTAAYDDALTRTGAIPVGTELGTTTLTNGVYTNSTAGTFEITGTLQLDALGNPNAVWIFQMAGTLVTAADSSVVLLNGALAANVFWQVGSSATLGANSNLKGTILALTSITLNSGASMSGRALARNGAVTLDANTITIPNTPKMPAPPRFDPIYRATNGTVALVITNTSDILLTIQTSVDLTKWTYFGTVAPGANSVALLANTSAPTRGTRKSLASTESKLFFQASYTGMQPVEGTITSPYGLRSDPSGFHEGIDIGVAEGTSVRAVASGKVGRSWISTTYGKTLIIYHGTDSTGNRVYTLYAHNSELKVTTNDTVSAGQVIALSGATGVVTGPHVHYEIHVIPPGVPTALDADSFFEREYTVDPQTFNWPTLTPP